MTERNVGNYIISQSAVWMRGMVIKETLRQAQPRLRKEGQHHQREWSQQRGLEYDGQGLYLSPRVQHSKDGWHWGVGGMQTGAQGDMQGSVAGAIYHAVPMIILNEIKVWRSQWSGNKFMDVSNLRTGNCMPFSHEHHCLEPSQLSCQGTQSPSSELCKGPQATYTEGRQSQNLGLYFWIPQSLPQHLQTSVTWEVIQQKFLSKGKGKSLTWSLPLRDIDTYLFIAWEGARENVGLIVVRVYCILVSKCPKIITLYNWGTSKRTVW